MPLVRATGSPAEVGRAHGAARATALRAFLADDLCRLNRILWQPVSMAGLRPVIAAYDAAITAAVPRLAAEIGGLAEGAGISREEAVLLQIRREVLGYRTVPARGDCTTYARSGSRLPVLAQTVDLNGDLEDQLAVLDLETSGRRSLVLSFAGQLGYLGLNSAGLAIGLNLLLGGQWGAGVPPYLAIRELLDRADDVDGAISLLHGLPLASSRCFMLCDRRKAAMVEAVAGRLRVRTGDELVHTNHFLHPDLESLDALNPFARRSSVRRWQSCVDRLAQVPLSAEQHFAVLSTPPIHVAGTGDIRRERTVATVVLHPTLGELHLRTALSGSVVHSVPVSFR